MIFKYCCNKFYYERLAKRIDRRIRRLEMGWRMPGYYNSVCADLLVVTGLLNCYRLQVSFYKGNKKQALEPGT